MDREPPWMEVWTFKFGERLQYVDEVQYGYVRSININYVLFPARHLPKVFYVNANATQFHMPKSSV